MSVYGTYGGEDATYKDDGDDVSNFDATSNGRSIGAHTDGGHRRGGQLRVSPSEGYRAGLPARERDDRSHVARSSAYGGGDRVGLGGDAHRWTRRAQMEDYRSVANSRAYGGDSHRWDMPPGDEGNAGGGGGNDNGKWKIEATKAGVFSAVVILSVISYAVVVASVDRRSREHRDVKYFLASQASASERRAKEFVGSLRAARGDRLA